MINIKGNTSSVSKTPLVIGNSMGEALKNLDESFGSDPRFQCFSKIIESSLTLNDGWNGGNAPKPSELARQSAGTFLSLLKRSSYLPTRVDPSVEGGFGFSFFDKSSPKHVFIEFLNSGEISGFFAPSKKWTEEIESFEKISERDFDQIIQKIMQYVPSPK